MHISIRTSRFYLVFIGALLGFGLVAACSVDAPDDVNTSYDELRALTANEIVGTLTYGQTSASVEYTESPLYRAFAFDGTAGDEVEIDVVAAQKADARAWLLGANFATLKRSDNASSSTLDARITHKLSKAGRYYIAFREANREEASFTVSLGKKGLAPKVDAFAGLLDRKIQLQGSCRSEFRRLNWAHNGSCGYQNVDTLSGAGDCETSVTLRKNAQEELVAHIENFETHRISWPVSYCNVGSMQLGSHVAQIEVPLQLEEGPTRAVGIVKGDGVIPGADATYALNVVPGKSITLAAIGALPTKAEREKAIRELRCLQSIEDSSCSLKFEMNPPPPSPDPVDSYGNVCPIVNRSLKPCPAPVGGTLCCAKHQVACLSALNGNCNCYDACN